MFKVDDTYMDSLHKHSGTLEVVEMLFCVYRP